MDLDRRGFLTSLALAAAALSLPMPAAVAAPTAGDIDYLAGRLTGFSIGDSSLAAAYLDAFSADSDGIQRLVGIVNGTTEADWPDAIAGAGLTDLARALVSAWYTGIVPAAGGTEKVVTYTDALAWHAVAYTPAPSVCKEFGSWSRVPTVWSMEE